MTAYGAFPSLPRVPAKVPSPNPQRPLALGSGNRLRARSWQSKAKTATENRSRTPAALAYYRGLENTRRLAY
jgi:hypothetical protein